MSEKELGRMTADLKCAQCGAINMMPKVVQNTGYYSKEAVGLWILVNQCEECDFACVEEEISTLFIEAQLGQIAENEEESCSNCMSERYCDWHERDHNGPCSGWVAKLKCSLCNDKDVENGNYDCEL